MIINEMTDVDWSESSSRMRRELRELRQRNFELIALAMQLQMENNSMRNIIEVLQDPLRFPDLGSWEEEFSFDEEKLDNAIRRAEQEDSHRRERKRRAEAFEGADVSQLFEEEKRAPSPPREKKRKTRSKRRKGSHIDRS